MAGTTRSSSRARASPSIPSTASIVRTCSHVCLRARSGAAPGGGLCRQHGRTWVRATTGGTGAKTTVMLRRLPDTATQSSLKAAVTAAETDAYRVQLEPGCMVHFHDEASATYAAGVIDEAFGSSSQVTTTTTCTHFPHSHTRNVGFFSSCPASLLSLPHHSTHPSLRSVAPLYLLYCARTSPRMQIPIDYWWGGEEERCL